MRCGLGVASFGTLILIPSDGKAVRGTVKFHVLGSSEGSLKAKPPGSLLFFITIAPLSWRFDVVSAAIARLLANIVNTVAMMSSCTANIGTSLQTS